MWFQLVPELLFCTLLLNFAVTTESVCKSNKHCLCSRLGEKLAFDCPGDEPKLSITVELDSEVKIYCLQEDIIWNDQYLPTLEQHITTLTFIQCPVPKDGFNSLIQKLGLTVTQLKFDFTGSRNITFTSHHFEGLGELESLALIDDNIQIIEEDVFKLLNELLHLELRANQIRLTENMFQYLSKIELLDLSQNELRYIPNKMFQTLTELHALYLEHNKLTTLHENVFENLWNLEILDLHDNMLENLLENLFIGLKNVKSINLAMNKLWNAPTDLFLKNPEIEFINLEGNLFNHLPDHLFANLTKLETILLNDCELSNLPSIIFHGSVHLRDIFLQNNKIDTMPPVLFKDLIELKNLDLSNNRLRHLPEDIFASLIQLESLKIEDNMLTNVSKNIFYNLANLEVVSLKGNRISFLSSHTFTKNVNLREIILSNNFLDIPINEDGISPFSNNLHLELVNLSHNNITKMGQTWWNTVKLKELDYSYNLIEYLDVTSLLGLSQKLTINLSHNRLQTINFAHLEAMIQLQRNSYLSSPDKIVVNVNENPIECNCYIHDFIKFLDENIDSTASALFTVIADNLLCARPKYLIGFHVTKLRANGLTCTPEELEVYYSCPEKCECSISLWDKSFIIDCRNRNLTTVPSLNLEAEYAFHKIKVYLQENILLTGPNAAMGYENVTELYLFSNQINGITWIPPKIEVLDLTNNNITFFDYTVLSQLNSSSFHNMSLGGNPWDCSCTAVNLTKLLMSQSANKQIDINNIRCKSSGNLLIHLSVGDLCPNNTVFILAICTIFSIIASVILALVFVIYGNQHKIKVWLFTHNLCLKCTSGEELDKDKVYDVFLCYAHQDEDFVLNELVPVLEQNPQPYKLCIHIRDWTAGEFICDQIKKSVQDSRRTLIVVSPNFLNSAWGRVEFKAAHAQASAEGRTRIIVVIYGDVNIKTDLDDDLKAYVATNTYIRWGEPWFWKKLNYALPHSHK